MILGKRGLERCWSYIGGKPVITVQLETDIVQKEKILQVDTGFSGWLLIDWDSYRSLGLERSELPQRYCSPLVLIVRPLSGRTHGTAPT